MGYRVINFASPILPLVALLFLSTAGGTSGVIEQRLSAARDAIAKDPNTSHGFNELAFALVRHARQTADPQDCAEAEKAVAASLKLAPDAYDGQKARVAVLLCQQRWADAEEQAKAVNKRVPDDVMVWGYLADAHIARGDYDAAEKEVQLMLDLRQVNPQGLQRGAELREIFGSNDAALEWWNSALRLTSSSDSEERAWILTRIARIHRVAGRLDTAVATGQQALEIAPRYPWALEEIGKAQIALQKYANAVETFDLRLQTAPPAIRDLFALGLAQEGAGDARLAHATFEDFEKQAIARIAAPDNANLELIRYYAGGGQKPAEAVRIARLALKSRHDIYTLEAYAHALAAAGDYRSASEQIALALKPGTKDPEWLLEAGRISLKLGDTEGARKYFQRALEAAPSSPLVPEIIQALSPGAKPAL